MATLPPEALAALGDDLLALLSAHASEERLALPLLRMVQLLLEAKRLDPLLIPPTSTPASAAPSFGARLLEAVRCHLHLPISPYISLYLPAGLLGRRGQAAGLPAPEVKALLLSQVRK